MKKLFIILIATLGLLFAACKAEEDNENSAKSEITSEGIILDGILFAKTAETTVILSQITVTGATPSYAEGADDEYKGVFIEGRTVTLSPFIMGKYEVTQELYKTVMANQKISINGSEYILNCEPGLNDKDYIAEGEDAKYLPVSTITMIDAVYFCNILSQKLGLTKAYTIEITEIKEGHIINANIFLNTKANGYRLPTEAEWEFAARGGDPSNEEWNYMFSGSDTGKFFSDDSYGNDDANTIYGARFNTGIDNIGWYYGNMSTGTTLDDYSSYNYTPIYHEVGKKSPNRLGIYDMSGSLREICFEYRYTELGTGSVTDPVSKDDFENNARTAMFVRRGGCRQDPARWCSVYYRGGQYNFEFFNTTGFRVVRSIK